MRNRYPELPRAVCGAIDDLVDRIAKALKNRAGLDAIERDIGAALADVGCQVVAEVLRSLDPDGTELEIDGRRYWQTLRASREYVCSFGRVTVERGLYRCVRNGPTICPLERRAQIIESFWTPRAARLAALSVSDMTPNRAAQFFAEVGLMAPSRSSLDRLPKLLNEIWESDREHNDALLRASDSVPPEAKTVAISLDGVMVSMRSGEKAAKKARTRAQGRADKGPAGQSEVGCGTMTFYDAEGERLATRRFARMPEPNKRTLKQQLDAELQHVRAQRPDLTVVAVADGAHNNWSYLESTEPDHQVLDFFHAAEHLKRALDTCVGASSIAVQRKYRALRATLLHAPDGAKKVTRHLGRLRRSRITGDHRDYRTSLAYFRRHADRMRYAELKKLKLPIGSGVIEGTCKSLATDRLKRAGMRWAARGGQAILNLRAWNQSDRFDAAWTILMSRYSHAEQDFRAAA